MTFAAQLKAERDRLGLTQAEAAALLDTPDRTYWDWETGLTEPPAIAQEGALRRLGKARTRSAKTATVHDECFNGGHDGSPKPKRRKY